MSVNDDLHDNFLEHAIALQKYSNNVVRRVIATLNRVDADLAGQIAIALQSLPEDSFTVQRLELLLGSVRAMNAAAYYQAFGVLDDELSAFSAYESEWEYQNYATTIPDDIQVRFPVAKVTPAQVKAAAMSRPFQGRLLSDWAKTVEADRMILVRNTIRTGYVEGKTASEIVRKIRGTKASNYSDGILERSRKDLMTVTQTAISHTANIAREDTRQANADIIKGVKWLSTLDSRTSPDCIIRDTKVYTLDHKPVGHKIPWLGGPGRIHFNCRSTDTSILKSWKELGFELGELDPGTRASMDGQVPDDTSYPDWIKRQSAARQYRVLGKERASLLRSGKVEVEDFYNSNGEFLTIDQLIKKDSALFGAMAA